MRKEYRIFLWLIIVALCLTFLSLFITSGTYVLQNSPKALDFLAFCTGAKLLSFAPTQLYNLHVQLLLQRQIDPLTNNIIFLPFLNPPFIALAFALLMHFGMLNAYILFLFINALLLVLICVICVYECNKTKWYHKLLLIIGIVTCIPIMITLLIGQLSIILCAIFLLAWLLLKKGKEFQGGIILSLVLIKPQFLILPFLVMLIQRRSKVLYGFAFGIMILIVLSYVLVGWGGISNYLALLISFYQSGMGYNLQPLEQYSFQTVFLFLFHTQSVAVVRIPWFISFLCIIIPTLFVWAKKFPFSSPQFSLQFALLIIAVLLISPHTPIFDLSLLSVVAVILLSQFNHFKNKQKKLLLTFMVLGYIILLIGYSLDILSYGQTQEIWISITVVYLIVYWVLLLKFLNISKN